MLVNIANMEDPDQTASSEAVWSGTALFVSAFWAGYWVKIFWTFTEIKETSVSSD